MKKILSLILCAALCACGSFAKAVAASETVADKKPAAKAGAPCNGSALLTTEAEQDKKTAEKTEFKAVAEAPCNGSALLTTEAEQDKKPASKAKCAAKVPVRTKAAKTADSMTNAAASAKTDSMSNTAACAKTDEFLKNVINSRESIHAGLNLTPSQMQKKNEIDAVLYEEIKPVIYDVSLLIDNLQNLANTDDCTKKRIDELKKEFRVSQKELSKIAKTHEKEFKKTLTIKQRYKYISLKRQARAKLKKQIKEYRAQNQKAKSNQRL